MSCEKCAIMAIVQTASILARKRGTIIASKRSGVFPSVKIAKRLLGACAALSFATDVLIANVLVIAGSFQSACWTAMTCVKDSVWTVKVIGCVRYAKTCWRCRGEQLCFVL
jgi:hypothetical protein